jgi:hypothetical protein
VVLYSTASSCQLPTASLQPPPPLKSDQRPISDHAGSPISLRTVQCLGACIPNAQPTSNLVETQPLDCVMRRIQVRLAHGCGLAVGRCPDWCGTHSVDDTGPSFRQWRKAWHHHVTVSRCRVTSRWSKSVLRGPSCRYRANVYLETHPHLLICIKLHDPTTRRGRA